MLKYIFAFWMGIVTACLSFAQVSGQVDPSFIPPNLAFGKEDGPNDYTTDAGIQTDGKIIVVGNFTQIENKPAMRICRLHPNGYLDTTFMILSGANNVIQTVHVLPDNKIMIGGQFTNFQNRNQRYLARLHPNGLIDTTFKPVVNDYVGRIELDYDGAYLLTGSFSMINQKYNLFLARMFANGRVDSTTFTNLQTSGVNILNGGINSVCRQPDGKYILGGIFSYYNGSRQNRLVRIFPNGQKDTSFNVGTGFHPQVLNINASVQVMIQDVKTDHRNRVLVTGKFNNFNGQNLTCLIRLLPNGRLDTSFFSGYQHYNFSSKIVLRPNKKMMIGGYYQNLAGLPRKGMALLDSNGRVDTGFVPQVNPAPSISIVQILPLSSGKWIVAGAFERNLQCLLPNGKVDIDFSPARDNKNAFVRKIFPAPGGKMYVTGQFDRVGMLRRLQLARLQANGQLDQTFPNLEIEGEVRSGLVDEQGTLWLVGNLSRINNQPCGNLVQISANGQVVLNPFGATLNDFVEGICKSPDGYYFVWGRFTSYQGSPAPRILKINGLGQKDLSFAVGSGFDNMVWDVVPGNNGDVFIRGLFTTYKTASLPNGLAVLDAQGNLQAAKSQVITSGTGFYKAPDQSILMTGNFFSNGDFQILKKLKPDFTWDTTFRAPAPPTSGILKIIVQPDGKIVGITNARQNNLFRLLPNGRTDTTFQSFPGPDHDATDFVLDANNKIVLAGKFGEIHGVAVPRLARLFNDLNTTALPKTTLLKESQLYPNPAHDYVAMAGMDHIQHAKATNAHGQTVDLKVSARNTISVDVLKPGCYVLHVQADGKTIFRKLFKE